MPSLHFHSCSAIERQVEVERAKLEYLQCLVILLASCDPLWPPSRQLYNCQKSVTPPTTRTAGAKYLFVQRDIESYYLQMAQIYLRKHKVKDEID